MENNDSWTTEVIDNNSIATVNNDNTLSTTRINGDNSQESDGKNNDSNLEHQKESSEERLSAANSGRIRSILISTYLFFILAIVAFILLLLEASNIIKLPPNTPIQELNLPIILIIFFFSISLIVEFINSILILATVWTVKTVNDSKIIWGLLGLFFLGFIATLIFCYIAKKSQK